MTDVSPHLLPVYHRDANLAVSHGEGVWLHMQDGRKMLDFASGIAVNALGHCHPAMVEALTRQAGKLWHVSNLYRIPGQEQLAERLCALSGTDVAFFCNSGAEAVETALKMARRYHYSKGKANKHRILCFEGAFHGRSMAAISAAGRDSVKAGYAPLLPGFDHVAFNDLAAVETAITPDTAAILIEPIQGEGGIRVAENAFLQGIRALCDSHGLLLICDEVQCGAGRSGKYLAHQHAGITADIICMAKGIGNGFPLGACVATRDAASGMTEGAHGGTYGGNPLAMAVGNAVLNVMTEPGFQEHVAENGTTFRTMLESLVTAHPEHFVAIRGRGLILGLALNKTRWPEVWAFVDALRVQSVLTVPAQDHTIRVVPPLIIEQTHMQLFCEGVEKVLQAG